MRLRNRDLDVEPAIPLEISINDAYGEELMILKKIPPNKQCSYFYALVKELIKRDDGLKRFSGVKLILTAGINNVKVSNSTHTAIGEVILKFGSELKLTTGSEFGLLTISIKDIHGEELMVLKDISPNKRCDHVYGTLDLKFPNTGNYFLTTGDKNVCIPNPSKTVISNYIPEHGFDLTLRLGTDSIMWHRGENRFSKNLFVDEYSSYEEAQKYFIPIQDFPNYCVYQPTTFKLYGIRKKVTLGTILSTRDALKLIFGIGTTQRSQMDVRFQKKAEKFDPEEYIQFLILEFDSEMDGQGVWINNEYAVYAHELYSYTFAHLVGHLASLGTPCQSFNEICLEYAKINIDAEEFIHQILAATIQSLRDHEGVEFEFIDE